MNDCDDDSAINFNPNSDDTIDCVYVSNIPSFTSDEDTIAQKDLNQYIQGDPNFYNNILFNVNCVNDINGIINNGCYINENNDLFVSLVEDFDEQTGFFEYYYNL